jgi:hypothetical protein
MNMEILPFESIGPLRFGEVRQAVRQLLGKKYRTFKKDVDENDTDAYVDLCLHLYYDNEDRLEFVEAFDGASASFRGIQFLGRPEDDVASDLAEIGFGCVSGDVGLQCDSAGIRLTVSNGIVEGVAVFRKGYYDKL